VIECLPCWSDFDAWTVVAFIFAAVSLIQWRRRVRRVRNEARVQHSQVRVAAFWPHIQDRRKP